MMVQRVIPQVHLKQVNVIQIVHLIQILSFHLIVQAAKILSYYYTCMVFLSGSESLHFFFSFYYIYVLPLEIQYKRGMLEYPRHIFVPALSQELDFQSHMSWVLYFIISVGE